MTTEAREFIKQLENEMDRMDVLVTKRPAASAFGNGGVWCSFIAMGEDLEPYTCHALVFAEPSRFGIRKGRVSKLTVVDDFDGSTVFHFDRGHREGKAPKGILSTVTATFAT